MLPDLTTFVANLSWDPSMIDCCRSWLVAYRDLLEQRFREYCARHAESDWLLDAFLRLPGDRQRDFLLCPSVAYQLIPRNSADTPSLAVLGGELVHVLAQVTHVPGSNSALDNLLLSFGRDYGDVQGIPLDFDSAFPFPARGADSGELSLLQPGRRLQAKATLNQAFETLKQGHATAFECVRILTVRLAVREEVSHPDRYASGSFGGFAGLTLLVNTWAVGDDTAPLIDALVHEAIHSAIYLYEALWEPLILGRRSGHFVIASPWTGRMLTASQYVQACFVWFGLANLWRTWPDGVAGVPHERGIQMFRRAARGFEGKPVNSFLTQGGASLIPDPVQDALSLLEQQACEAIAPALPR